MKATRYMRRPFIVTGYKVTAENMVAVARWCRGHVIRDTERPFIRVPVSRYTNIKQTEAYIGLSVILSIQRGEESFKVYSDEWLEKNFIPIPREIEDETGEQTIDLAQYLLPKDEVVENPEPRDPRPNPSNVRHLPTQKVHVDQHNLPHPPS